MERISVSSPFEGDIQPYDDCAVNGAVSPSFHDEEEGEWAGDCDGGFPLEVEPDEDDDCAA